LLNQPLAIRESFGYKKSNIMKNFFFFSVIAFLLSMSIISCDDDTDIQLPDIINTPAELSAALNNISKDTEAPGFAVTVIKDNAVVLQEAFGYADLENNRAYTNQTMQPIGSISKTFIAAAIVKAIEQGYFTLETDINDILPVEVKNPKQPNAIIRVKHLVTHTSGLLDNDEAYFQAYHILPGEDLSTNGAQLLTNGFGVLQREGIPLEEYLAEYYLEDGDLYSMDNFAPVAPGTSWNYSNIASSLSAYLVAAATEMSFKEYVQINILQPLGMNNTAYDIADLNTSNLARLYWDKNTPLPNYANDSYPDGSINTSNEDLAKYLMAMMKGANGQASSLFSKEGYDLLFGALLPDGLTHPGVGDNQGIFWVLEDGDIKHDGSDPGTTCNLQFDEGGNAGYLILTNMDASTDEHEAAWYRLSAKIHATIAEFVQAN